MSRQLLLSIFVFATAVCVTVCAAQAIATGWKDDLRTQYEGKQVMLRNFYCGGKLKYDEHGVLLSGGHSGPWTLCMQVKLETLKRDHQKLKLTGRRIYLFYSSEKKQFQDVTGIMDQHSESYKNLIRAQEVSIEINLPPAAGDQDVQSLMNTILYSSQDEFAEASPEIWKAFFERSRQHANSPEPSKTSALAAPAASSGQTAPAGAEDAGEKTFHVGKGVSAPVPLYSPDPDYSEEARQARFQGTTALTVIVGTDGRIHRPSISLPLGMGLDERAAEKVLTWKFRPATKDGQPVNVEVKVEVQFNLY